MTANDWNGTLMAASHTDGQAGNGVINLNDPGAFTYKLVPDS